MWMSDSEVEEAIVGMRKLVDVYGWPTPFHDTIVEQVLIERDGPTVTMLLRTNEADIHEDRLARDVITHTVMRWHEVDDLHFSGVDTNNWIDAMRFCREEALIRTEIEMQDAFHGFILSKWVEVVSVTEISKPA